MPTSMLGLCDDASSPDALLVPFLLLDLIATFAPHL